MWGGWGERKLLLLKIGNKFFLGFSTPPPPLLHFVSNIFQNTYRDRELCDFLAVHIYTSHARNRVIDIDSAHQKQLIMYYMGCVGVPSNNIQIYTLLLS